MGECKNCGVDPLEFVKGAVNGMLNECYDDLTKNQEIKLLKILELLSE